MLEIRKAEDGSILFSGRFDASQEQTATAFMETLDSHHILDFSSLEYISSAGLGALLGAQKRLKGRGGSLHIINANKHIRDVFFYSGLARIFEMA